MNSGVWFGIIIVLFGFLLLLENFNFGIGSLFRFFPLPFIAYGIWQLKTDGRRHWMGPSVLIAIMSFVQLSLLGLGDIFARLWPALLIFVGGSILYRQYQDNTDSFDWDEPEDPDSFTRAFAMFSGSERQVTAQNYGGGDVVALFGGVEIDLERAEVLSPPAVINVLVMFGGASINARDDMVVDNQVLPLFGGASDDRIQPIQHVGQTPDIIVRGLVLFGGLAIENSA